MKNIFLLLLITFILVSCASTQNKPKPIVNFVTHITDDGTKKFSLSLISPNQQRGQKNRQNKGGQMGKGGGRGNGGNRGGQGKNRSGSRGSGDQSQHKYKMREKLFEHIERKLFESEYCNEGYIKLDILIDSEVSQYKGKCKELASQDDRNKFPNEY